MTKFLTGHGVPPGVVGAVRGAIIGAGIAGLELLINYFTSADLPAGGWLVAAPIILAGLRSAEGVLDGLKSPPPDPTKSELPASANK